MPKTHAFATRLPTDLTLALDETCRRLGLRKNFVVEAALKEKLEDLLDADDLKESARNASGFHAWDGVKKSLKGGK